MNEHLPGSGPSAFDIEKLKSKMRELWDGHVPLFQTFWFYFFAAVFVLNLVAQPFSRIGWILSLAAILWSGFMVRPIILSADRYQGDRMWARLAKIAAVLIGLSVIIDLLFG